MIYKLSLLIIFILSIGLRLINLSSRPLGFTWDEAALGYNAYSLLLTGRDEHAQVAPIVFKSFGDFKPGLYIYFTVPAVALLGLNEFSTRVPSAIFGSISVLLVFILARSIFDRKTAIFSALLMAINPWAIHFSRAAWESNLSLSLTLLGTAFYLRHRFLASAISFGLTFWTYQGAKLFTPLVIASLAFVTRKTIPFKSLARPLVIILVLALPILLGVSGQSGRLKVFSVFSYTRPQEKITEILSQDASNQKDLQFFIYHSELLDQLRGVALRYLNHFSPRFLFFEGDWSNTRQSTPFFGYLHLPEIVTLLAGLYFAIKAHRPLPSLLLIWLLLAPIPSALSRDIISAVRSLPMVVPLVILSGLGLSRLWSRKIIFFGFFGLLSLSTIYFLDLYLIHGPHYIASGWLYPYKPALNLVSENINNYSKVVFSDKLGQPYIFTLFHLKINPRTYQGQAVVEDSPVGDVGKVTSFDKFEFRPIFWPQDRGLTSTLFIGEAYELPESDLQATPNLVYHGAIAPPDGYPLWHVVGLP